MKICDLLKIVNESVAKQWWKVPLEIPYQWEEDGIGAWRPNCFGVVYVYGDNADISLALGAVVNPSFEEPWALRFPDRHARSVVAALRYRGSIVYQWVLVEVDGGRSLVPMPTLTMEGAAEICEADLTPVRLFFKLHDDGLGVPTLEACLHRAGVTIIASPSAAPVADTHFQRRERRGR